MSTHRNMANMTTEGRHFHMEEYHAGYDDTGRVVSEDTYLTIVHEEDHGREEGIIKPHSHAPRTQAVRGERRERIEA